MVQAYWNIGRIIVEEEQHGAQRGEVERPDVRNFNYYTHEMMNDGDTRPIGIILCADRNEAVVRYTLPEDNDQIFASHYKLYLPSEDELVREL